jgi:(S)-mandelate dehydrogenase
MGGSSIIWPGADLHLALAAQRARIPYTLSTAGGATIEDIARVAPDVFWFQLYRLPKDQLAVSNDLVRRAEAAGCRTLMLTLDVPVRTTRPREVATGITAAFNINLAILGQITRAPSWALAVAKNGVPRFANLRSYVGADAALSEVVAFAQREIRGAFTWEEVKMYRDRWKGTVVVKGVLHPEDADQAVSVGVDGIIVSNHG